MLPVYKYLLVNVVPNAGVCAVPKVGWTGFANVLLPKGVLVVVPNPTVCPNPVLAAGWPKSGFV